MSLRFDWSAPPLDQADQRLVDAYATIGRPLDELPYTGDFERMRVIVGLPEGDESKHFLFKRLLRLRKMGRLPRLGHPLD